MVSTWTGTSSDWTNAAAWSGGAVPAATDGVVFPDASAYTATVGAGESVGAGSVTVNSDVISLQGATVRIAPGGTLTVAGPFVLGSGTLDLAGTLVGTLGAAPSPAQQSTTEGGNGTGFVLAMPPSATGTLFADGGKIVGNPALLDAGLNVTGDNLTVQAPDGGPGQVTLGGSTLSFLGTQTFDDADVTLDHGTIESGQQRDPQPADVLTFGPNLQITATNGSIGGVFGGSLVNEGTIDGAFTGDVRSFINEGTVRIGANQTASLLAYAAFTNAAGALIAIGPGATATLGSENDAASPGVTLNAGTITVATGARLTLNGSFDLTGSSPFASLGTISNAGTLILDGTLVNTGATLRRSAFDAALGTTAVSGTLVGGTFIADDDKAPTNFSTLDGVMWQGAVNRDGNGSSLTVLDSLSMRNLDGTGQGSLALGDGATMIVRSATTLGAAVTVSGTAITVANGTIVGSLTLAPDSTLSSTMPGATATVATSGPDTALVNQGTITAAAPGGLFTIGSPEGEYGQTTLTNLGRIVVAGGDTMHITGPIAAGNGSGEFDLATDGTLRLDDGSGNGAVAGVAAGNNFLFEDGSASVLALDPEHFAGMIAGFQPGNAIDLHGFFTGKPEDFSASAQPGRIAVTLSGQLLGNLATAPGENYSGATFVFGTDGNGGATMQIAPANPVLMTDTTTGATYTNAASAYAGPYGGGLASQFIYGGAHSIAVRATTPSVFLVAGSGTNALAVTSGNNVLSSGAGSAFMVGGSGDDTFFLDGRSGQESWDTVVNFHAGDAVTLWGFVPGTSKLSWTDSQGASGYTGATLHVDVAGDGRVDDAVTFAGFSRGDASHLALSTGTAGGVPYLALGG